MAHALFPRIPITCRALPARVSPPQRRFLWTLLRTYLIGSPESELFRPTVGRWLWDEDRQVALHTRTFNVRALKDAAAEALGVAGWRVRLNKFSEGGSSKIVLARGGGKRVIVKLPDPVVPARVAMASEVAVMEFARAELDIPTPKVLAWSWDAAGPVGAEYVIMEEAEGDMVSVQWDGLEPEGKAKLLKEVIGVDERLLRSSELFKNVGYGSLYFTEDAEKLGFKEVFEVKTGRSPGRFCLGPLADKHFWADATADIDRGPWPTAQAYLTSLTDASLHHFRLNGPHTTKTLPFLFNPHIVSDRIYPPALTTLLLNRARLLVPGIVHPTLSAPTLWHPDLSHFNVFVAPSGRISSVIDWQYAYVLPLFLQACIPALFRSKEPNPEAFPDPVLQLQGEDLEDKEFEMRLELTAMARLYVDHMCAASGKLGEELRNVLDKKRIAMSRILGISVIGERFEVAEDTVLLWAMLIRIIREWDKIAPGMECPVELREGEIAAWQEEVEYRNAWLDFLDEFEIPRGTGSWVSEVNFEVKKEKMKKFVRDLMQGYENDESDERRKRVIKHMESWKLTDWNEGKGWIDGVDDGPELKSKPAV